VAASRKGDYPGSRADVAHARVDYPGPRADILADSRARQRMDSPNRQQLQPDPFLRHGAARRSSPAGVLADQFSRPTRQESPGRLYRRNEQDAPHAVVARLDAGQPMRRDESPKAPKVVMPSSSDIILQRAVPAPSDKKLAVLPRKYLVF